jgi:MoaA/NifB/PqqE/SkfB family radical SAM enzyme
MQRKIGYIENGLLERIITEGAELGVKEIGLYTTGDPLMHKGLEHFTSFAKEKGFSYAYISTNGAAGGPDRFKSIIDAGIDSIKFSINAGTRETYKLVHGKDQFDRVIDNLRFVSEYRKTLGRKLCLFATFVVTNLSEPEQDRFRELVGPLVDEIFFSQSDAQKGQMLGASSLLGATNEPVSLQTQEGICPMPFNRIHVTNEGYLTLCCVDYQNYLAVADLKEMSLKDAWHSPAFQKARQSHLENKLQGTLCGNCWYGRMDKIQPLDPKLASAIDFESLYREQETVVQDRIDKSGLASPNPTKKS